MWWHAHVIFLWLSYSGTITSNGLQLRINFDWMRLTDLVITLRIWLPGRSHATWHATCFNFLSPRMALCSARVSRMSTMPMNTSRHQIFFISHLLDYAPRYISAYFLELRVWKFIWIAFVSRIGRPLAVVARFFHRSFAIQSIYSSFNAKKGKKKRYKIRLIVLEVRRNTHKHNLFHENMERENIQIAKPRIECDPKNGKGSAEMFSRMWVSETSNTEYNNGCW